MSCWTSDSILKTTCGAYDVLHTPQASIHDSIYM